MWYFNMMLQAKIYWFNHDTFTTMMQYDGDNISLYHHGTSQLLFRRHLNQAVLGCVVIWYHDK